MGAWGTLHQLLTACQEPIWVPCREGRAQPCPNPIMTLPHCVQPFSKGPVTQRAEGRTGQMQEQLQRRRCPWAVLSMAWLPQTRGSNTTGAQDSHTWAARGCVPHQHHPNSPITAGDQPRRCCGCVNAPRPGTAHDSAIPPTPTLTPGPCDSSPWTLSQMAPISSSDAPCLGLPVVDDIESLGHGRRSQALAGCSQVAVTPE